jgi:hypothetical protein
MTAAIILLAIILLAIFIVFGILGATAEVYWLFSSEWGLACSDAQLRWLF